MTKLKTTVQSIITTHQPAVICFSEVGECSHPLTKQQMTAVTQWIEDTWQLLQSTQLQHSFSQGAPYLTVWDSSQVDCFNFHITHCYEPQYFRTAQLFGMRAATLEVDMVNIHLSSGTVQLRDPARKGSLENILFRRKSSLHAGTIGQSPNFLVGGDMNTSEYRMSVIFSEFKKAHLLQSDAMPNFLVPPHGKPGDLAIAMDHAVSVASGQARNHDHQHVPVALKLLLPDPSPDQGTTQRVRFCPDTTQRTHPGET